MLRMSDFDLAGKRLLIREDLNVPIGSRDGSRKVASAAGVAMWEPVVGAGAPTKVFRVGSRFAPLPQAPLTDAQRAMP